MSIKGDALAAFVNRLVSDVRTIFPMYVEDEFESRVNGANMQVLLEMTLERTVECVVRIAVRWFAQRLEPIGIVMGSALPTSIALKTLSHFQLYSDVHVPTFEDVARFVADGFVAEMEKLWADCRKLE